MKQERQYNRRQQTMLLVCAINLKRRLLTALHCEKQVEMPLQGERIRRAEGKRHTMRVRIDFEWLGEFQTCSVVVV